MPSPLVFPPGKFKQQLSWGEKNVGKGSQEAFLPDLRVRVRRHSLPLTVHSEVSTNITTLLARYGRELLSNHHVLDSKWSLVPSFTCFWVVAMMKVDICSPVWKLLGNGGSDQVASGGVPCRPYLPVCVALIHCPRWIWSHTVACPSGRSVQVCPALLRYRISTGQEAVLAVWADLAFSIIT